MTPVEMQYAFIQHYETITGITPRLFSEDIFFYLNEAQRHYVDQKFKVFEEHQQLVDELRPLVVKEQEINARYTQKTYTTSYPVDFAKLPTDCLYVLNHKALVIRSIKDQALSFTINDVVIGSETVKKRKVNTGLTLNIDYTTSMYNVRRSQSDDILRFLDDPFNKPIFSDPVSTISRDGIAVYTNSRFIVDAVVIDYLKIPPSIDPNSNPVQSSILPEFNHKELVELAVNLYLSKTNGTT